MHPPATKPSDPPSCICTPSSSYSSDPAIPWDSLNLRTPRRSLSVLRRRFSYRVPCRFCANASSDAIVVSSWLSRLGLSCYAESFRSAGVCPATLLSITSAELVELGVTRLADRRLILVEVSRQRKQPAHWHLAQSTPEHGRILTHLSNDRIFLLWVRVCIVILTLAVTAVRLVPPPVITSVEEQNRARLLTATAIFFVILAVVLSAYALVRFFTNIMISNYPTVYPNGGERMIILIPLSLSISVTAVTMYMLMAHEAREIAAVFILTMI